MTTTTTEPAPTTARTSQSTNSPVRPSPRGGASAVALAAVAVIAVLTRWWPVHQGAGVGGRLDYDDGVYYAGAAALLGGRLPYDDFLLLHPPGMLLVLVPFVPIGEATTDMTGFAVARVAFWALGAVNALLVAAVVRGIIGRWPGVLAGLLYAVWRPAAYVERTTELEPLVCTGLLASALLVGDGRNLSRRRALAAGAVLGAAMTVKVWAGVPLVVIAAWLALRGERAAARSYVLGGAAVVTAVCLPFFVAAPSAMVRMVVLDQLGRPSNGIGVTERLASLAGVHLLADDATPEQIRSALVITALLVAVTVAGLRAGGVVRLWAAVLVAQTAVVLAAPVYFDHYTAYLAPACAVLVTCALVSWTRALVSTRAVAHPVLRLGAAVGVGLTAFAVDTSIAATREAREGLEWRPESLAEVVAARGCVVADNPGALIAADVLTRDIRRGCPLLVDPTGFAYEPGPDLAAGPTPEARMRHAPWQRMMQRHLTSGDVVIVDRPRLSGLSPETRARVEGLPLIAVVGRDKVYDVPGHGPAGAPEAEGPATGDNR